MRTTFLTTVVIGLVIASTPALAISKVSGKYTISGTEICQVVTADVGYGNKGKTVQELGIITLTPTKTTTTTATATGVYVQNAVKGSLADPTDPMTMATRTINLTITVTGTANPYSFTMTGTVGGKAVPDTTGYIELDNVVSGIAKTVTMLGSNYSGDTTVGKDCSMLMRLIHQ